MTTTLNASTAGAGGFIATGDNSGSLALQTAGTTAVTIDASQNVGIGATPSEKFNVTGTVVASGLNARITNLDTDASARAAIQFKTGASSNVWQTFAINGNLTTGVAGVANYMTLDSSGNLCVNSTSQVGAEKLGVKFNGAADNGIGVQTTSSSSGDGFVIFRNSGGTAIGTISRVSTTNAVAYNTTSDERLKSNIADSQSVLDKLMDVKVRQFDWTEGNLHQDYGFIAQELEPILSGVVSKGKTDEDMWQLDYSRLTPHLVKAIQELKAINDTQAETINALTARLAALESKVGV